LSVRMQDVSIVADRISDNNIPLNLFIGGS